MPTQKPRITFTIDEDKFEQLEQYRYSKRMKNQTQAVLSLIDKGLEAVEPSETKKAPAISAEAMKVAKDYDGLPYWGRNMVRSLIRDVAKAAADMNALPDYEDVEPDINPETPVRTVPLFRQSMAAGPAEPANEQIQMFDNYEIPIDSQADFAIRVNGTSAEPYLHDGQIALGINRQPGYGEVGAFQLDAEFLIKQIVSDHVGNIYLLSLNRAEEDKDVTIWAGTDTRQLTYIGTIILDQKPPLPKI